MDPQIEYFISSGAWSIAGLLAGYLLGRLEHDVHDIKRIISERKRPHDDTRAP